MSAGENGPSLESDIAKAFQEVAKGEQTAAAVESQLDALESLIDELLADAEAADRSIPPGDGNAESSSQSSMSGGAAAGANSKS